jgi:hypothetical protein
LLQRKIKKEEQYIRRLSASIEKKSLSERIKEQKRTYHVHGPSRSRGTHIVDVVVAVRLAAAAIMRRQRTRGILLVGVH